MSVVPPQVVAAARKARKEEQERVALIQAVTAWERISFLRYRLSWPDRRQAIRRHNRMMRASARDNMARS